LAQVLAARSLPAEDAIRGILLMCAAFLLFSMLDATAKLLRETYPLPQVVWARYAGQVVVAILLIWPHLRHSPWRSTRPGMQILRGMLLFGATLCNIVAVRYLQLAETAAIYFSTPLLVAAMSVPILGERVGPRRWAAIAVGFIGVLIVIRPGYGMVHWAVGFSCLTALCGATYQILTRKVAGADRAHTALLYSGAVGAVAITPFTPLGWITPDGIGIALMIAIGFLGGLGHWLLTIAHAYASAPTLAPFSYTQIIWMPVLGYLLFGDVPTIWTLAGGSIVVASGLYLLHREQVVKRQLLAAGSA
jgi:drug/metabolite transporter (DMT)-like permease